MKESKTSRNLLLNAAQLHFHVRHDLEITEIDIYTIYQTIRHMERENIMISQVPENNAVTISFYNCKFT